MDFQVSTGANVKNVPVKNTSIVVTNPMNNQFTAKNTGNNNVVINMVDQNGRVIFTQNLDAHSSLEKDMSAVANGVYTLQIQDLSNNSISYQKLIK
jgi:DNA-binding transcriptional regulator/RsmH inhibitor MraZ